jgi:hypothetical protein
MVLLALLTRCCSPEIIGLDSDMGDEIDIPRSYVTPCMHSMQRHLRPAFGWDLRLLLLPAPFCVL